MKKHSTTLKKIGLTLASLGAVMSTGAIAANNMHVKSEGGIMIYNPSDSAYWFSVGGRMSLDETVFSGKTLSKGNQFASGGNIRRALLKFAGGVGDYLSYNLTLDFARPHINSGNLNEFDARGRNGTSVDFEDAYINASSEFTGAIGISNLRLGQFTPPTSIDDWGNYGTNNDTMFLESSLATSAFAIPSKVYGVWFDATAIDMFMLSASVFHPKQNNFNGSGNRAQGINSGVAHNNNYGDTGRSDRLGAALRLTFAPVHTCDTVYHLGVMGRYQSMNNTNQSNAIGQYNLFQTTPEARARQTGQLVNTGFVRGRSYSVVNGEALAMWGPATVEGEIYQAIVQRVPSGGTPLLDTGTTQGNPRFHGWHIEAAYVLTGEHRVYDFETGTLRNPKPCDKAGAWEVAARYSFVNMVDKNIYGGSEHNTTLGLNWFVNEHVKVSANYIRAKIHPTGRGTTVVASQIVFDNASTAQRKLDIVGLRLAVAF
ncbi:MAG TPA: porin [Gammaproteobacteria bacterium]|nr:porin [Gammaproteobacteria bacterium]